MSSYTPPKGRSTPSRNEQETALRRANRRALMEWVAVAVVGLVLVVVLAVVFGDLGSDGVGRPIGGHG